MTILEKPSQNTNSLSDADVALAQGEYWNLFTKTNTTPRGVWDTESGAEPTFLPIEPSHIEIADFSLSGGTLDGFRKTGLGIITVVNASECVKYLLSLPGQVLPWHAHVSVLTAPPGFKIPSGHRSIGNPSPNAVYFVPDDFLERTELEIPPEWKEQGVTLLPGKEETFTILAGSLEVYSPGEGVLAENMPEGHRQFATQRRFDLMPGDSFPIPRNRPHLAIGGPAGCVYLESSTRSRDGLDHFFHKAIRRIG